MENTSLKTQLGTTIARLRTEFGVSQASFALMVGVSRKYLIDIESGKANPTVDMLERIAGDSAFPMGHEELTKLLDASAYVGRAPEQAETFILQEVDPILASAQAMAGMGEISV